jgi:hypothetical protein
VHVSAAEACAVRAVPVLLDDHGTAAAGASAGQGGIHGSPPEAHAGLSASGGIRATGVQPRPFVPARLAVGFGLKGCPTSRRAVGRRSIHPIRDGGRCWFPRPLSGHPKSGSARLPGQPVAPDSAVRDVFVIS